MKFHILITDDDPSIPDEPLVPITRVQLSAHTAGTAPKGLRKFLSRSSEPTVPTLSQAIHNAGETFIVVVSNASDLERVRAMAPKSIVMSDLNAAITLAQGSQVEALNNAESVIQADPENLYRITPTSEDSPPRLITDDQLTASEAISRGMLVGFKDSTISGFISLQEDHARYNGSIDAGYYGVRARAATIESHTQTFTSTTPRLLIAPANYAGQSWAWAQAVRTHVPTVKATNLQITPRAVSGFAAQTSVTATEWRDPSIRLRIALEQVLPSTHVLIEAMRALIGSKDSTPSAHGWDFALAADDVLNIHQSGRKVGLLFHGSEIRRPDLHATFTAASPFSRSEHADGTEKLRQTTDKVHALIEMLSEKIPSLNLFVSTPDLLDYIPTATWLPIVVPRRSFEPATSILQTSKPRVLHAPTNPFLKGSDTADQVLSELADQGVIDYVRVHGVQSGFMPDLIREVDVVVDQIVLGNPGVLAAETMSAGRLAVAHLPDHVRARFPTAPPIVEASRTTLDEVIRDICNRREHYLEIAQRGPSFAEDMHDGRRSAAILAEFMHN